MFAELPPLVGAVQRAAEEKRSQIRVAYDPSVSHLQRDRPRRAAWKPRSILVKRAASTEQPQQPLQPEPPSGKPRRARSDSWAASTAPRPSWPSARPTTLPAALTPSSSSPHRQDGSSRSMPMIFPRRGKAVRLFRTIPPDLEWLRKHASVPSIFIPEHRQENREPSQTTSRMTRPDERENSEEK